MDNTTATYELLNVTRSGVRGQVSAGFAAEQAAIFGQMVRTDLQTAGTWTRLGNPSDAQHCINHARAYAEIAWRYATEVVNAGH